MGAMPFVSDMRHAFYTGISSSKAFQGGPNALITAHLNRMANKLCTSVYCPRYCAKAVLTSCLFSCARSLSSFCKCYKPGAVRPVQNWSCYDEERWQEHRTLCTSRSYRLLVSAPRLLAFSDPSRDVRVRRDSVQRQWTSPALLRPRASSRLTVKGACFSLTEFSFSLKGAGGVLFENTSQLI